MKLLSTLILFLVGLGLTSAQVTYSSKYDNVDVDAILGSERLFKRYLACILDEGSCSPDGRYFRTVLPDALATNCEKCTRKMKINVRKVSNHVRKQRPDDWAKFVRKYDSDNKYIQNFERFLNE